MAVPTAKRLREYLGDRYTESDEELIDLYVDTHKFYRRLKKEVAENPLMMRHTNKAGAENLVKNPLAIELTKTVTTLNNLLKSLDLTPAQRKELNAGGGENDDDYDEF
ncbi:P27 family phage terminase small subunit [Bacillus mojavensis]|uniref:Phage terminase, small subunit n=1 Tax=Bacillus mojavensis TaxID=72360 RepID=A0ABX6LZ20_BACMO|nr:MULTISPECIES: P27 family phage terminase small subunit [Bacillus subtilis group]MCY8978106.1 P27 family phage terminase small subunit [Bacillus halotolerans]MCY9066601.1 P27 family phage terminase small subunit [Bacillus inaquosorum]MEC1690357.1 P27 family phage terminase small subunit [Bacillus mojavensis]MED1922944.1 P27 family phage terminase small subunit [Bacillus velezensis]QJC97134.1 Phage terminase, small subunit [Bacillus mojavensis]